MLRAHMHRRLVPPVPAADGRVPTACGTRITSHQKLLRQAAWLFVRWEQQPEGPVGALCSSQHEVQA
jgi:hypothetical protein